MNIILLSGGSGKRLWPLSNDVRSKQFIKLFKNKDKYESMVQRVYRQITTIDADAKSQLQPANRKRVQLRTNWVKKLRYVWNRAAEILFQRLYWLCLIFMMN